MPRERREVLPLSRRLDSVAAIVWAKLDGSVYRVTWTH